MRWWWQRKPAPEPKKKRKPDKHALDRRLLRLSIHEQPSDPLSIAFRPPARVHLLLPVVVLLGYIAWNVLR